MYHIIMIHIPNDVLNTILEYDGQIKYRKRQYINIIHKHDYRYHIIEKIIKKNTIYLKMLS